jgi:signal transduction histidine kinase
MQLDLGKFNIINVIENTVTLISDYAKNKNINLVFDTEVEEVITMCDADKIERVMFNLLSNAIKFTPKGGDISVMVSYCNDTVEISIKDTGIGIPEDKLNKIFEKFMQVDKSFTRDNEGSGLGLYIVKSIVEMHGGTINVVSILKKGSNFIVSLPVKKLDDNINNIQVFNPDSEMLSIEFSDIFME